MEPIPAYFILLTYTHGSQFTREMSVYIAVLLDEVEYLFDTPTDSSDIRRLASHYKNSQIGDHHKLGIILYEYLQQPIGKDRTDWALKKGLNIDVLNRAGINSKRILTIMQREQIEVSPTPIPLERLIILAWMGTKPRNAR